MGKNHKAFSEMIYAYKIRKILTSIIVFLIFAIVIVFAVKWDSGIGQVVITDTISEKIGVELGSIKQISIKNGFKEWSLKASCISVDKAGKSVKIDKPEVEFFSYNNDTFYLSAISGLIDSISNRMNFYGNVCGQIGDCIIKTERMLYDPDTFSLISDAPVVFFSEKLNVNADNVVINLSAKSVRFNGNVESVFINAVSF